MVCSLFGRQNKIDIYSQSGYNMYLVHVYRLQIAACCSYQKPPKSMNPFRLESGLMKTILYNIINSKLTPTVRLLQFYDKIAPSISICHSDILILYRHTIGRNRRRKILYAYTRKKNNLNLDVIGKITHSFQQRLDSIEDVP